MLVVPHQQVPGSGVCRRGPWWSYDPWQSNIKLLCWRDTIVARSVVLDAGCTHCVLYAVLA